MGGRREPQKNCTKPNIILVSLIPWKFNKLKLGIPAPISGKEDLVLGITALIPEQGMVCPLSSLGAGSGKSNSSSAVFWVAPTPDLFWEQHLCAVQMVSQLAARCSAASRLSVWLFPLGTTRVLQPQRRGFPAGSCRGLAQWPQGRLGALRCCCRWTCSRSVQLLWKLHLLLVVITILTLKLENQYQGSCITSLAHGWVVENHTAGYCRRGEKRRV